MKALISGMSGFIGQALKKRLESDGCTVIGVPRGFDDTFPFSHIFDADYICHLAAYGNHSYQNDISGMILSNILYTNELFSILENNKCLKRFYNFSTSSVTLPVQTPYSITKKCAEEIAIYYKDTFNLPIVNIRPYSVYGIGEANHRFIPTVIKCLLSGEQMVLDENATHDWIFIESFIDALLSGHTEIGSGIKTTNKQVVELLEQISGKKLNYKPGKLRVYDNDNWVCPKGVPCISLKEGLEKTFEHYSKLYAK
jgi:UDP-glucuronate 4-epimerase